MKHTPQQLDSALTDVRKAYRLLHDYQRLAMDAVAYIGRQLGLTYDSGWSKYENAAPRDGHGRLTQSAWDWLNMMLYEFYFERDEKDGGGMCFSILLISDTGYFIGEPAGATKSNPLSYAPAELSKTCVAFMASTNVKAWKGPDFVKNPAQMRAFLETGGELPEEYGAIGIVAKCCDFKRLATEDDTNRLIDELVSEFGSKRIPLKRLERKA